MDAVFQSLFPKPAAPNAQSIDKAARVAPDGLS